MNILRTLVAAGAVALAALAPAQAQTLIFTTEMTGPAESPPNTSPGFGTAMLTFDVDDRTMLVRADFGDLTAPTTIAHVHCCTAEPFTGVVAPATGVPTFPGFPAGVTAGSYERSFDMTLAENYNAPFLAANGSPEGSFFALLAGIESGRAYFNIHTTAFPGGEIRGFLQPIPEPSTYVLMVMGLALLGWTARRRAG